MAQRFFQSFRKLPNQFASVRKKQDTVEVVGNHCKINVCSNIGFPAKPSSIAYDHLLDLIALVTRDGLIYVYGKPGVMFSGSHKNSTEIIKVVFINGTGKLLTLSDSDDLYIWEIVTSGTSQPCLQNVGHLSAVSSALEPKRLDSDPMDAIDSHITALVVSASTSSIIVGTDQGSVAVIRRNTNVRQGVAQDESSMWILPQHDEIITPHCVLQGIAVEKRPRLVLDAVVVLMERPGCPGQLLIGYASGVCVLYDLVGGRSLAVLPCQYELEAATWCGGTGHPVKGSGGGGRNNKPPPHLGTRLLTAYANGSLGVWQVPLFATGSAMAVGESGAQALQMMESPSMPYGPFPCKLISKVFWLPSKKGGITIFAGGMPRSIYGDRNTVSILRGSNLDQAAAANLAAARRADSEGDDNEGDDDLGDDDEETGVLLASGLVPGAPVHVFDSDAPEHVCLDFPSAVVDMCPVGPAGGPVAALLVVCEEELVAVDLLTPGWPLIDLPYLTCLHASSLTAYGIFTQVDPGFLKGLEALEGSRGDACGRAVRSTEVSPQPWPIAGSLDDEKADVSVVVPSNDLLVTGHENGVVEFWRLAAGGCAWRIFTLFTGSLFEGEFGPDATGDAHRGGDEEAEPWPPFRRVGVFDPFTDDVRAAIKVVQLIDNTLVVGGAAGQVSVWQLAESKPAMVKLDVPIAPELPGFRWKGHAPLTVRQHPADGNTSSEDPSHRIPGTSLYPLALALCQPPSPVTCLAACELKDRSTPATSIGVLVGIGTAHGFALTHFEPSSGLFNLLLHHTTLPANAEALEEAAVGEGWARRRTRELKNSLRDSFRRLKRMKSGRGASMAKKPEPTQQQPTQQERQQQLQQQQAAASKLNASARVGLRKSVTRSTSGATRTMQVRGDPLQEALARVHAIEPDTPLPTGGEREIRDRPTATANTALVRCLAFGPPLHHRLRPPPPPPPTTTPNGAGPAPTTSASTSQLLGSFFAGTAGGMALVYAVFADNARKPTRVAVKQATTVQLQHRAPIVALRLIDTKTHCPLISSTIYPPTFSSGVGGSENPVQPGHHQPTPPHLMVVSEEQVRLFALPSIQLRQKARITAKDGFRIKTGDVMAFGQFSNDRSATGLLGIEFNCVFTNNGGQAVVLSVPHLRRRDTIGLLGDSDVLEINSIVFATPASSRPKVMTAPSLGVYQTAPGQLAMFDVVLAGQRSSVLGTAYRMEVGTRTKMVGAFGTPSPSPGLQKHLLSSRNRAGLPPNSGSSPPVPTTSNSTRAHVNGY